MTNKTRVNTPCDDRCPVRASLTLLSGKWTLMILFQINENVVRYGELKRAVTGISEKMLIQELNMLVENKLVSKKVYQQIPPKVEYRLTKLGLKTLPIVDKLAEFGLENLV
ncbi:winged helix-turn-helix transcriptional regulator [Pedobacter rhizosphaerae]|uniref:Transcriptional regulator, HxlR family n=1 Tax=Pedobacter rhizosphaerae TaxID=390241 RepID=A0A1H9SVP8_9SPHI|nr:helix-turn-helix domain-containing protein [Pedobacter rhizosphaerae]SER88463.1 transcriptional regulator, HxlR family [Pedobacter rhizosphaerae]